MNALGHISNLFPLMLPGNEPLRVSYMYPNISKHQSVYSLNSFFLLVLIARKLSKMLKVLYRTAKLKWQRSRAALHRPEGI